MKDEGTNRVEITLGRVRRDNRVVIDGTDITNKIRGLDLSADNDGSPPILTIDYPCFGTVEISGETRVVHYCPMREEAGD